MALRVDDAHLQGRGPQRQLASDLSQPDDPELLAVKCLESGDARPIAVGRVFALVTRRRITRRAQLLLANQIGILSELSGQREHQGKRLFGRRNIGAAPDRQYLNTSPSAGRGIDVSRSGAILLDDLERISGRRNFSRADGQGFHHDGPGAGKIREQFGFIVHEPDSRGIKMLRASAHTLAPAGKVRQIMRAEVGKCRESFGGRGRIEYDLNQAKKGIILDD